MFCWNLVLLHSTGPHPPIVVGRILVQNVYSFSWLSCYGEAKPSIMYTLMKPTLKSPGDASGNFLQMLNTTRHKIMHYGISQNSCQEFRVNSTILWDCLLRDQMGSIITLLLSHSCKRSIWLWPILSSNQVWTQTVKGTRWSMLSINVCSCRAATLSSVPHIKGVFVIR